jgi:hypothetical protein
VLLQRFGHDADDSTLHALAQSVGQRAKVIQREKNYFVQHAWRMNCRVAAGQGWPIGLGAVESARRQGQGRFKCCGQFWTPSGLHNLCALTEARHNGHWNGLRNSQVRAVRQMHTA